MSADNGIYIAKFGESDFRVCHAQAIDNVDYYIKHNQSEKAFDYWRNSKIYPTKNEAIIAAHEMEEEYLNSEYSCGYVEYGVNYLGDYSHLITS